MWFCRLANDHQDSEGCFGLGTKILALLSLQHAGDGIGQLLVGVLEQQRDVPHLVLTQNALEGGHPGEADAVLDLPVSLSGLVIADADDVAVAVLLPKLRSVRIHIFGEGYVLARDAVAACALQLVGHGAGLVDVFADAERWLLHLAIDAGAERYMNDVFLKRKGFVGDRNRRIAELEIGPPANEEEDEGEDEAEEKL